MCVCVFVCEWVCVCVRERVRETNIFLISAGIT